MKIEEREFPGGPAVRNPCFQGSGYGFDPLVGELKSHMPRAMARKKKNREKQPFLLSLCSSLFFLLFQTRFLQLAYHLLSSSAITSLHPLLSPRSLPPSVVCFWWSHKQFHVGESSGHLVDQVKTAHGHPFCPLSWASIFICPFKLSYRTAKEETPSCY